MSLVAIFLVINLILSNGILAVNPSEVNYDEGYAEWVDSNGQSYLHIVAKDYDELGLLKGQYLANEILTMKGILNAFALQIGLDYATLLYMSNAYNPNIPEKYALEFEAIADGVNLVLAALGMQQDFTYQDVVLQNSFIDILFGQIYPSLAGENMVVPSPMGCTAFGAMNYFLNLRFPTVTQNFDFPPFFLPSLSFVLSEVEGSASVFALHLGSCMLPTGENSYGVSSVVNVVQTRVYAPPSVPSGVVIRDALENSKSARDMISKFLPIASYNLLIADDTEIISIQVTPIASVMETVETWDVNTNTFTDDSLKIYLLDPLYSVERQQYTEDQLSNYYQGGQWLYGYLAENDVVSILSDSPIICRNTGEESSQTVAFYSNYGFFGLQNTCDAPLGVVPAL